MSRVELWLKKEATMTAKMVVEAGADAKIESVGFHESRPYMMIPTMLIPLLFTNVKYAAMVKNQVTVPVAAIGSIIEPIRAANVIKAGKADLVALGRALLSDPEWPIKPCLEGLMISENALDVTRVVLIISRR